MVTKSSAHEGTHSHNYPNALAILVIISIILNILSLYFLMGYSLPMAKGGSSKGDDSVSMKKVLLDLEYEKVGGQENYDILQKYSQMQIKEQIPKIKEFIDGGSTGTPTETAAPQGTLSQDEIKALLATATIEGNKDATIVAIEYSDMECPFCMRQYHETKLFPSLLAQYGNTIATVFKNNRGVNHAGTEAKSIGALCAGKVGGAEAYTKFYKGVMDKSTDNNNLFPVSGLADLAKSLGVDAAKWQTCVNNKETLAQFTAETSEAQKYGLGGTPGTLIVNVKTGKYATVEGAYPYTTFTAKIDELLK